MDADYELKVKGCDSSVAPPAFSMNVQLKAQPFDL